MYAFYLSDFYQIEVQRWESKNIRFVKTDAVKFILQTLHDKNCVTVIGAPSVGKSSAMWNAVLHLRDTKGYSIVPCRSGSDIAVNYRKNKNQVLSSKTYAGDILLCIMI
jgi:ABC-type branched-subunit amino acid transport system ATPase component